MSANDLHFSTELLYSQLRIICKSNDRISITLNLNEIMQKSISLIIALLILGGGVWYFTAADHDSEHGHDDHHDELVAKEPVRADGEFTIVTSFYPLAFALETLTADVATVTNIGEGRDPHDVQLSTANVRAMQEADFVVLQGAGLETWTDDVEIQLKREEVPLLKVTDKLELREGGHSHDHDDHEHGDDAHDHGDHHGEEHAHSEVGHEHDHEHSEDEHMHEGETHEHEHDHSEEAHDEHSHDDHDHGAYDPHTWLDPVLFSQTVGELVEALSTLDPDNASLYEERGNALQAALTELDQVYENRLATCTYDEVITSHDAFSYLGARYGFTIHTIAGLSTQDQPSAQTLAKLREEAEEGVGAILLEQNSITAYGETLAAETGLRMLSINPVAYDIPAGEDYLSIMEQNLNTLADALQCS